MATTIVRDALLVSNDFPFSVSLSSFWFLFPYTDNNFPFFFCLFSYFSSSFFSILHRSGKDPPRVALHERVVDEESVKLALRQHYPAGYRYLGCLVISSRVRPPV